MRTKALWVGMILFGAMCAPGMADWVDCGWDFNSLTAGQTLSSQDSSWSQVVGPYSTYPMLKVALSSNGTNAVAAASQNTLYAAKTTVADVDAGMQYTMQMSATSKATTNNETANVTILKGTTWAYSDFLFQFGVWDGLIKAKSVNATSNGWVDLFTPTAMTPGTWYDVKLVYTVAEDGSGNPDTVQASWKLSSGATWTSGSLINVASNHEMNLDSSNYLAISACAKESTLATYVDNVSITGVPEPATMGLLAVGGLGVLLRRKR